MPISSDPQFDVVAIGDTTQDIFLKMSDAAVNCDINKQNCKICFDYADKIAVDEKDDVPAVGNAANHAIGIARLGLKAAIYTVVGDDTQGHLAQDVFTENNVDSRFVAFDEKHGTNFSAVINFQGERTIFVYHEPREYQLPDVSSTRAIYLTSASGDGVRALHEQALHLIAKHPDIKVAFNPGTHQIHLGPAELKPLLQETDIIFLNREESADVLGMETRDIKELMKGFNALGITTAVITDGPDGSYVSDGATIWHTGIFDGPVIERTGAGDSFGSGFLGALLSGKNLHEAVLWGNANSTSVVQYVGAREGLLTPKQVEEAIAANPGVTPEEFGTI